MPLDHTNKVAEALEDFITPPGIPWGRIALLFIIIGLAHVAAHFWVWNKNGRPIEGDCLGFPKGPLVYECRGK